MLNVYIDLGTTNLKFQVYDENQTVILEDKISNADIYFDKDNYIVCNKIIIYIDNLIRELISKFEKDLKIIFSSAMHTLLMLDSNYNVIRKGNTLLDPLSKTDSELPFKVKNINGLVPGWFLPMYKMLFYLKQNKNENFKLFTTLKSYILLKFCDKNFIELSDACGLGLIDLYNHKYSNKILKLVGISEENLPTISNLYDVFECFKYSKKVLFSLGVSDGVAAAFNEYSKSDKSLSLSIGTTLGIRKISEFIIEPKLSMDYCFPVDKDKYVYGISSSNGGNNLGLALKVSGLSFSDLNKMNYNGIVPYEYALDFFKERDGQNKVLNIEDFKVDEKLFFSLLYQLTNKVYEFKNYIDTILNIETSLSCTGGVFENPTFVDMFDNKFKDKFIISKTDENLSIEGLKKLFK